MPRMILASFVLTLVAWMALRLLLPRHFGLRGSLLFWALALLLHGGWWATRIDLVGRSAAVVAVTAMSTWMVATIVLATVGLAAGIVGWAVARLRRRQQPEAAAVDLGRRRFLAGAAVPIAAFGTGAGGTAAGFLPFVVRQEEFRIRGLPAQLDGFRIGQITDLHVGIFVDPEQVREAVEAMNRAGCDLQVMTGDLIDDLDLLDETMEALDACTARHGMVAILGNHEKWRGEAAVVEAYRRIATRGRVRLLVDERLRIDRDGVPLHVVGVDYPMRDRRTDRRNAGRERRAAMERSAERAFAGIPAGETILCLTHHPDFFHLSAERGARLTLAGHTHGGQVAFFGRPLFSFAYDFMLGRYRLGDVHAYVSGGTGHWLPFRLGVPTEVTIVTLRAA